MNVLGPAMRRTGLDWLDLSPRTAGLASPPPVPCGGKSNPTIRGVFLVKSVMADPRGEFVNRIDLRTTRVKPFEGFIFLCGGPQDVNVPVPDLSVRHILYHAITSGRHSDLAGRLKLAEDIQDWYRGGKYSDLVTFEEHLASLSSVIILVVESAGSIAELGAFSVTDAIADRLIALISETHFDEDSFIKLGPISRLESRTGRTVLVHSWHERRIGGQIFENYDLMRGDVPGILNEVRKLLVPLKGEKVFKTSEPSHAMLLICELCDLFGALSETEIKDYFLAIGCELNLREIEQYLFILNKCDLLRVKAKGHGRYFYAPDWKPHIIFGFRDSEGIERNRLAVNVFDYYKSANKTRYDVVSQLRGGL